VDTIVGIATTLGISSISIVRISGLRALEIVKSITKKSSLTPRYATLSNIYSQNQIIDEAIVIYFKAPNSFTTEDVIEIQSHGGYVIANLIVEEVLKHGVRLAEAGEFTKRAFLGGRIDLSKAEAIAKMIEAKSSSSVKILARHLKGELRGFINSIRDELVEVLAYIEVNIDYAEEDLPKSVVSDLLIKLDKLKSNLENSYNISIRNEALIDGFKVSIIGKPNVGKSSLLNKLVAYDRAIVSDIAGTTRDTIEESIRLGNQIVKLIDTAGIRYSDDLIEKIGIERTIDAMSKSDIIIALFDSSKELEKEDLELIELLKSHTNKKIFVVLNKIDLNIVLNRAVLSQFETITISCKRDIEPLLNKLSEYIDSFSSNEEHFFISKRQLEIVKKALLYIAEAIKLLKSGKLELSAFFINEAIREIVNITEPFERTEILDKMFGNFCLGK